MPTQRVQHTANLEGAQNHQPHVCHRELSCHPDHFAEAAEAEAVAKTIKEYAPQLIPGLLQTEAYARAVFRAYQPTAPENVIDDLTTVRLDRAHLLSDPTTPLVWAVLDSGGGSPS